MHLRATETKPKASIAERAVILLDLLGNNREPLGGVPLISIFKREWKTVLTASGHIAPGWKTPGEREGLQWPVGAPGGARTDSRRFSVVKIYVYAVFVRRYPWYPIRDIDITVVARPDTCWCSGNPSAAPCAPALPSVLSPLAVACPRAHAIRPRPEIRACHAIVVSSFIRISFVRFVCSVVAKLGKRGLTDSNIYYW